MGLESAFPEKRNSGFNFFAFLKEEEYAGEQLAQALVDEKEQKKNRKSILKSVNLFLFCCQ